MKGILEYIKNNTTDNSLKHEKDAFINELGRNYRVKLFDELKEYLE
jgi:hypothetical protein